MESGYSQCLCDRYEGTEYILWIDNPIIIKHTVLAILGQYNIERNYGFDLRINFWKIKKLTLKQERKEMYHNI